MVSGLLVVLPLEAPGRADACFSIVKDYAREKAEAVLSRSEFVWKHLQKQAIETEL